MPWLGALPFIAVPQLIALDGEGWRALGLMAFFGSLYVGIRAGWFLAIHLNNHLLKKSVGFEKRLTASFSCFDFLLLPPLMASLTNPYLGTEIGGVLRWAFHLGLCVGVYVHCRRAR